ncbi:ferritin-like fold-containing protein [Paenarthrobacter sp. PH39-S1]|uniref:ferritin-like fold-containing protein n=1 Tax=Paenarthrobacter sp. PH39-S1 TaxID=3046204 RepID=UPI0024B915D6|nr:ferritin-like fold-containing protein [Paenarthrobacter sp. PH39-S1]MDJ0355608.1 ferritin-like fold-containing protein [Paenarthrobacter sp. PH39-S1]
MSIPPGESAPNVSTGELNARYDKFVVDLLGVIAYGELSAFERLSSDARYSPTLHDRAALGRMAVTEFEHFDVVRARLAEMNMDVELAMRPFQQSIDSFHDRTRPADWYESLMKAYVVDAISGDFYRAISEFLDQKTREVINAVQTNDESGALLQDRLKKMLADDPRLASRLALWGRRLVGEALTQAQRVGTEHSFLRGLMIEDELPAARNEVSTLLAQLTKNHSRRMSQLGLTA